MVHLLLLLHGGGLSLAGGGPGTLQVKLAGCLPLESEGEPFVETARTSEGADLSLEGTDGLILGNIFIEDLENHIVTDVLNVEFKRLVPDG